MADEKALAGRTALVTGASRGIGAAIAEALAADGAHVVLTARTEGGLVEVESRIHAAGGTATIAPMDLLADDQVERLASAVALRWRQLDIAVLNAAALGTLAPLTHVEPAEFNSVFALNVTANFRLLRAFELLLRRAPAGRVLGLTSSVGTAARAYWGPYAASKAALENLLLTFAEELRNVSAVRVAIVDPGATRTSMRARAFPGEDPARLKAPEVVGRFVADLLHQDFETGARVRVPSP